MRHLVYFHFFTQFLAQFHQFGAFRGPCAGAWISRSREFFQRKGQKKVACVCARDFSKVSKAISREISRELSGEFSREFFKLSREFSDIFHREFPRRATCQIFYRMSMSACGPNETTGNKTSLAQVHTTSELHIGILFTQCSINLMELHIGRP